MDDSNLIRDDTELTFISMDDSYSNENIEHSANESSLQFEDVLSQSVLDKSKSQEASTQTNITWVNELTINDTQVPDPSIKSYQSRLHESIQRHSIPEKPDHDVLNTSLKSTAYRKDVYTEDINKYRLNFHERMLKYNQTPQQKSLNYSTHSIYPMINNINDDLHNFLRRPPRHNSYAPYVHTKLFDKQHGKYRSSQEYQQNFKFQNLQTSTYWRERLHRRDITSILSKVV